MGNGGRSCTGDMEEGSEGGGEWPAPESGILQFDLEVDLPE